MIRAYGKAYTNSIDDSPDSVLHCVPPSGSPDEGTQYGVLRIENTILPSSTTDGNYCHADLLVDDIQIEQLQRDQYIEIELEVGEHTITGTAVWGCLFCAVAPKNGELIPITVDLESFGKTLRLYSEYFTWD